MGQEITRRSLVSQYLFVAIKDPRVDYNCQETSSLLFSEFIAGGGSPVEDNVGNGETCR